MSSLPRKTGSNSVVGGLASVVQQRAAAKQGGGSSFLPSAQYLDALNVLCEATMAEACSLLLSEKDYEGETNDRADYKKLLEIEKKCRDAVKVIHKEAPAAPAMMPPTMPTLPTNRSNNPTVKKAPGGGIKSIGNIPKGVIGKSIAPSVAAKAANMTRRGSMTITGPSRPAPSLQGKRAMAQQLHRAESDDSSVGSSGVGVKPANKKARLAAPSSTAAAGTEEMGGAPPPSALNFLKKLNKDKAAPAPPPETTRPSNSTSSSSSSKAESKPRKEKTKEKSKEKPKKDKEKEKEVEKPTAGGDLEDSDAEVSVASEKREESPPKPSPREGTRKNPKRGARST
jgi:hypothetical protein